MKKILLFAKNGQLGWELQRTLAPLGQVIALDYPEVDFSKPEGLRALVREYGPDMIVNPAAYTAVDKAETQRELTFAINRNAPEVLAEEAKAAGIPFIHYSTDYVYDGRKGSAYLETDAPHPLNVYGQSKLEGDQAIAAVGGAWLILRTSWVYSLRQGGFVTKVLQWARQQEVLRVVDDQTSGPTAARLLAEITSLILMQTIAQGTDWLHEKAGIYHCAGDGSCSRFEWAEKIMALDPHPEEQRVKALARASSSEFPVVAERPLVSVLNCDKLEKTFGLRLPSWEEGLRLVMGS